MIQFSGTPPTQIYCHLEGKQNFFFKGMHSIQLSNRETPTVLQIRRDTKANNAPNPSLLDATDMTRDYSATATSSDFRGRPPFLPFSADVRRFFSELFVPPLTAKSVEIN